MTSSESSLIGALLNEWPEIVPLKIQRLLLHAPKSFDDQRYGILAVAIRSATAKGIPVHSTTVCAELDGMLEQIGGLLFVEQLASDAPPMSVAEHEAEAIWERYSVRRTSEVFDEGTKALESAPEQRKSVIRHLRDSLDEILKADDPKAEEESTEIILKARQFDFATVPTPVIPRYFLGQTPICTPGNLTAISAAVKAGKTSALTAMLSSTMASFNCGLDFLGFKSDNPARHALIHIDTEQSREDHDEMVRRAIRRSHLERPPDWLFSFCLTGIHFLKIQQCLKFLMSSLSKTFGGIHSALLDGVADMVADVNEPEACNAFVADLHSQAIQHSCPIVGIIHLNPGTEKTRGHLGSQLERKAETNLRLEREGENDTIVMWSDKNRRAPISKATGPRFAWNSEAGMHLSVDFSPSPKTAGGRPSQIDQIATMNSHGFLAGCLPEGESRNGIARRLEGWLATQKVDAKESTCIRAIAALCSNGKLAKGPDLLYRRGPNA